MHFKKLILIFFVVVIVTTGCQKKESMAIPKEQEDISYFTEINYNEYQSLVAQNQSFILEIIEDDNYGCNSLHQKMEQVAHKYNLDIKYINVNHISDKDRDMLVEELYSYTYPRVYLFKDGVELLDNNIYGDTLPSVIIKELSEAGFIQENIESELYKINFEEIPYSQLSQGYYSYELSESNSTITNSITLVIFNDNSINGFSKYGNCSYFADISNYYGMSNIVTNKCFFNIENESINLTLDTSAGKSSVSGIIKNGGGTIVLNIDGKEYELENDYYSIGKANNINEVLYDPLYSRIFDLDGYDYRIPRDKQEQWDLSKYTIVENYRKD